MVNNLMKNIIIIIATIWLTISISKAQTTYQKYDGVTRGAEYHIAKSQIESNKKFVEMLKKQKESYSVLDKDQSVTRSRIQGVISAKENESFRLNQKAFMLMDANKISDVDRYNSEYNQYRPTVHNNGR
jgi:NADH:ubiquinone oxidoreductase subunit D